MLDDQERRQKILTAASETLRSYGYHAASMDSVAQSSGMSKKTLYQFFPSKRVLFETLILERLFTPNDIKTDPSESLEKQLTGIMVYIADKLLCEERLSLMRSIIAETSRNPDIRQRVSELFHLSGQKFAIQNWLKEQDEAGYLKIKSPKDAGDHLFGITIGVFILSELTQCTPTRSRTERLDYIKEGIRVFLAGYKVQFQDP